MKTKLFLSVACLSLILSIPAFAQPPEEHAKAAKKHLKTFEWDKALSRYKKIVKEHPHSPQAAEAHNQIGLDHKSHKRYDEAIEEYQKVIDKFPGTRYEEDAKTGIAAVYIIEGKYEEALTIFEEVLSETTDWDQIKYCSHWIRRLKAYISMGKGPVACGPYSLHTVLALHNIPSSLEEITELTKSDKGKVSLATLAQASKEKGLEAYGLRLSLKELRKIEKPVIVLTEKDHYQVLTGVNKSEVTLIDEENGRYSFPISNFKKMWDGYTLAFSKKDMVNFKSAWLSPGEMEKIAGGVCPCLPPGDIGMPGPNTEEDTPYCGSTVTVNTANGNTTITGTDATSGHSLGPSVVFKRYYNSDDPYDGPLGHSWTHNYNVNLSVKPNGDVHIMREDSRRDIFRKSGEAYIPPKGIYDILTKNLDGSYTLEKKDKTIQSFDPQGRLISIADKSGNQVTLTYDQNNLLTEITDASGRITNLSYNPQNRIEKITDPAGRNSNYLYDQAGNLISTTNLIGETTTYTYDWASYLISMTSSRGTVLFSYGGEHMITGITNSLDQQRQYRLKYRGWGWVVTEIIDENGNKTIYYSDYKKTTFIEDALGNTTYYKYDENDNRTAIIDARGNRISYTYDERGNHLTQTDPLGNTTTYTYDGHDNQTSVTDPKGNTTHYTYDENSNLTSIQDSLSNTTFYTYDNNGLMTSMTDPKGSTTYYEYDAFGNLIKVSEPQGRITSYTYDGVDNRTSMTDPNGNTTYYTYDVFNRLTQITNPDNTTIQYEYDCCNLIKKIDEKSQATSYEYDAMNRLIKVTDAQGNITQYTYDNVGNRLSMTDAKGNTTSYTYDELNRLTKVTYPDGTGQYYEYDKMGNRIREEAPNGSIYYTYDTNNRLIVKGEKEELKEFFDDFNDNDFNTDIWTKYENTYYVHERNQQIEMDPSDNTAAGMGTNQTYKDFDVTVQVYNISPHNWRHCHFLWSDSINSYKYGLEIGYNSWSYYFDRNRYADWDTAPPAATANAWHTFRLKKVERSLEYYIDDILVKTKTITGYDIPASYNFFLRVNGSCNWDNFRISTKAVVATSTFTYDENGNRIRMTDDSGETKYTYDKLNRLVEIDGPRANDTISYTYDQNGNLTGKTDSTGTSTYTYDSLNRLIQVTSAEGRVTSYEYDLVGNRTRTTLPNGIGIYYSYDERNRLLTLSGGPVDISYTYDAVGNRLTKEDGFYRDSYAYDLLNQLTKEEKAVLAKRMPPGLKELPKGFEKGKKKGFTEEGLPRGWEKGKKTGWPEVAVGESVTTAYTYDSVGNRLSMDRNGVVTNYTYDVANKLLAAGDTSFKYDANGNLTGKTDSTGTTNYTYDYENRLLSAGGVSFAYDGDGNRISRTTSSETVYFVNDVNLPLTQVLLEQNENGDTLAAYTYGLELISMTKGASTHYYIYDGLGNVVAVTDNAGQTIQTYDYDAFGNVISTTGSLENPYQFVGGYGCADDGIGLLYMRARYYMPETGRFTSRDPWEGTPYDPQSLNRYVYCSNNPVNWVDPEGLKAPWKKWYGNWCGKGWSGGEYPQPGKTNWNVPATDDLDAICKKHDGCTQGYDPKTGQKLPLRPSPFKCKSDLCKDLEKIQCKGTKIPESKVFWIKVMFGCL